MLKIAARCRSLDRLLHRSALALLLAVALPPASTACAPYAHLTESGPGSAPSNDCGGCHVEVYAEWAASAHAEAWTNESFITATSEHRFQDCLGCHAPESVFVTGAPTLRKERFEEGVHCIACHLDEGALAGPAPSSALLEPHPMATERELYRGAEFCGKCHMGTFREWSEAPLDEKRTCQECHMESVTRKLTQSTDSLSAALVYFEEEYEGRRHSFHLDSVAEFEGAVAVRIERVRAEEGQVRADAVVEDLLPHAIPTGDFGFRRATLEAEALGPDGAVLATSMWELYKEMKTALQPLEPRRFPLELPAETASVRLRLSRSKRTGPSAHIHDEVLELP